MKKNLLLLLLLLPTLLFADSWEELTMDEARQVQEYLIQNPYILDYCDCCNYEGEYATKVHLMKIKSIEIRTSELDIEYFTIFVQVETLAEIPYTKNGLDISSPIIQNSEVDLVIKISMNYTWGYDKEKAVPLCNIIPYRDYEIDHNSGVCKKLTSFPNPKLIKNEKYKRWYEARF
jgi:hypothetical protein